MKAIRAVLMGAALMLWSSPWGVAAPTEQAIKIKASEWKFQPAEVMLAAGVSVQLTEINDGTTQHDFSIEALGVSLPLLDPGKSQSVRFTPTKKGTFEFKCTVPGHAEAGMKGTITVK